MTTSRHHADGPKRSEGQPEPPADVSPRLRPCDACGQMADDVVPGTSRIVGDGAFCGACRGQREAPRD
ncbi:MAG: hypothetical protein AB7Q16_17935 [Vicinamibacterales bacterium]